MLFGSMGLFEDFLEGILFWVFLGIFLSLSSILFCGFLDCLGLVVFKLVIKLIGMVRIGSWENVWGSRESFYKVKEGMMKSFGMIKSIMRSFGIIKLKNGEEKKGLKK